MNIDWSKAPEDATHAGNSPYERGVVTWFKGISDPSSRNHFMNAGSMNAWAISSENLSAWDLIERPKKQEAWNGEGLPTAGEVIEIKIDFKNAPPYVIINLTELGIDVQKQIPTFQKAKVLYSSEKYLIAETNGRECLAPMSCTEFRPIKTAEQVAAEEREAAITDIALIFGKDPARIAIREKAGVLYDAGYRKQ